MKRYFLTGGCGFIGKQLVQDLILRGEEVFIYDLVNGQDIRDLFGISHAISMFRPDIVVHMAARAGVGESLKFPKEYIETNIIGTQNVVSVCEALRVPLIFFSSSSVLGGNKRGNDGVLEDLSESERVLSPKSLYGITKLAGEQIVLSSNLENRVVVRPFTVYGLNGRRDMVIEKIIESIKNGKKCLFHKENDEFPSRGFTYVKDLTQLIISIAESLFETNKFKRNIYHISGGTPISTDDLRKLFQDFCFLNNISKFDYGFIPSPKENITHSFSFSSFAKQDFGFSPSPFDETLHSILKSSLT